MSKIPKAVGEMGVDPGLLSIAGVELHQGKVCNNYLNVPGYQDCVIQVRTNRISSFDFVLNVLIAGKGLVLTNLSHYFIFSYHGFDKSFQHHYAANTAHDYSRILKHIKSSYPGIPTANTIVATKTNIIPIEFIFRKHPGGSVWNKYLESSTIAGVELPSGLKKWAELSVPLFTPSTKEKSGHDVNITVNQYLSQYDTLGVRIVGYLMDFYKFSYELCKKVGIILLDTKYEVGISVKDSQQDLPIAEIVRRINMGEIKENEYAIVLADEINTCDSSRYTSIESLETSLQANSDPGFLDKQVLRDYLQTLDTPFNDDHGNMLKINKLDPNNPEHLAFVHSLVVPDEIIEKVSNTYCKLCETITDLPPAEYSQTKILEAK